MNTESASTNPPNKVLLIGCKPLDTEEIAAVLKQKHFDFESVESAENIRLFTQSQEIAAVVLDFDELQATSRMIRGLARLLPGVPFLGISEQRLHPELEESFQHHIYACLVKPLDPDEFGYWLKSFRDNKPDPRAPP